MAFSVKCIKADLATLAYEKNVQVPEGATMSDMIRKISEDPEFDLGDTQLLLESIVEEREKIEQWENEEKQREREEKQRQFQQEREEKQRQFQREIEEFQRENEERRRQFELERLRLSLAKGVNIAPNAPNQKNMSEMKNVKLGSQKSPDRKEDSTKNSCSDNRNENEKITNAFVKKCEIPKALTESRYFEGLNPLKNAHSSPQISPQKRCKISPSNESREVEQITDHGSDEPPFFSQVDSMEQLVKLAPAEKVFSPQLLKTPLEELKVGQSEYPPSVEEKNLRKLVDEERLLSLTDQNVAGRSGGENESREIGSSVNHRRTETGVEFWKERDSSLIPYDSFSISSEVRERSKGSNYHLSDRGLPELCINNDLVKSRTVETWSPENVALPKADVEKVVESAVWFFAIYEDYWILKIMIGFGRFSPTIVVVLIGVISERVRLDSYAEISYAESGGGLENSSGGLVSQWQNPDLDVRKVFSLSLVALVTSNCYQYTVLVVSSIPFDTGLGILDRLNSSIPKVDPPDPENQQKLVKCCETEPLLKTEINVRAEALARDEYGLPIVVNWVFAGARLKLMNYTFILWISHHVKSTVNWTEFRVDKLSFWYDTG